MEANRETKTVEQQEMPWLTTAPSVSRRRFVQGSALGAAALLLGGSSLSFLGGCAAASSLPATGAAMSFKNITERLDGHFEADVISMTEARSFRVTVPMADLKIDEVQSLIDDGRIGWSLSREKGLQDPDLFPHQVLGGDLLSWQTVATEIQPQQNFFVVDGMKAVESAGGTALEMEFSNAMLFGYDGIDTRDHKLVRNSILDYTGTYQLACLVDGEAIDQVAVAMRPYDYYLTQAEIDEEIARLVDVANESGIYAEVRTLGHSADGRDVNAVFVAREAKDLEDYQALVQRAEADPAAVQEEVRQGTLKYKVPIVYSNIHPDETVGSDSVIEFFRLLASNQPHDYFAVTGLTEEGKRVLGEEMEADRVVWSDFVADKVTGVGYIQGDGERNPTRLSTDPHTGVENPDMAVNLSDEEFARYYETETLTLKADELLEDVFFIFVPSENPDGRSYNVRVNGNGFDLNRDNTYQTQPETQAMTQMIAEWNPIALYEIHGYWTQYQVEPCSPAHDPNNEYDLFIDTALEQGEAYIAASIANNASINGAQIPMRDYLKRQEDGSTYWEVPFDDMTSSYTPQYAMLHGANAYTVETPFGSQDAVDAVVYGFVGNARFVADNKDRMFLNQLERFRRGVENIDADSIRPYYVSQADVAGGDAEAFRPRYAENGNFFPEFYAIPFDETSQRDRGAAQEMITYLLRNGVSLQVLEEAAEVPLAGGAQTVSLAAGTVVVSMYQAKRNMANAALYANLVLDDWTELYSEPVTNFPMFRGFDAHIVAQPGVLDQLKLAALTEAPKMESIVRGSGKAVVVASNGLHSIRAINELLESGAQVGFVTEGDRAGDYVMDEEAFARVKDAYVLDAEAMDAAPESAVIRNGLSVYVPGRKAVFMQREDGAEFGVRDYESLMTFSYNWDRFALAEQMGFTLADDAASADVIVGYGALSEEEAQMVAEGKPYVGYGMNALESAVQAGIALEFDASADGMFDALAPVSFPERSLVTECYRHRNDTMFYGHDGSFITKVPDGASVLVQLTKDNFTEGFMAADHIEKYRGSIQAVEVDDGVHRAVLFANTLANKAHQVHEYRFISSAIFAYALGEKLTLA